MAILFVVEQPGGKPFEFGAGIAGAEARQYVTAFLRQMRGEEVWAKSGTPEDLV